MRKKIAREPVDRQTLMKQYIHLLEVWFKQILISILFIKFKLLSHTDVITIDTYNVCDTVGEIWILIGYWMI